MIVGLIWTLVSLVAWMTMGIIMAIFPRRLQEFTLKLPGPIRMYSPEVIKSPIYTWVIRIAGILMLLTPLVFVLVIVLWR